MRLNDDVWRHTCSYGAAADLARLVVVGAVQRGAVAASVATTLRRPDATTRDLYLAELRAQSGMSRIAQGRDTEMYVVARNGVLVRTDADVYGNDGDAWSPNWRSSLTTGARCVAVAAGVDFLCAVSDAALVYSWGRNAYGQLGLGRGLEGVRWPTRVLRRSATLCPSLADTITR